MMLRSLLVVFGNSATASFGSPLPGTLPNVSPA
jgi:hypothetical protein